MRLKTLKTKNIGVLWASLFIILLVAACIGDNSPKNKYPIGQGYGTITDSTFYYFTEFTDGSRDTTFFKCLSAEMDLAMEKIFFGHIYAGLNWEAQKEYHEKLCKIKTEQYWPNKGN
jgi:hypothetical protein